VECLGVGKWAALGGGGKGIGFKDFGFRLFRVSKLG
jgi:hypothetical protein